MVVYSRAVTSAMCVRAGGFGSIIAFLMGTLRSRLQAPRFYNHFQFLNNFLHAAQPPRQSDLHSASHNLTLSLLIWPILSELARGIIQS